MHSLPQSVRARERKSEAAYFDDGNIILRCEESQDSSVIFRVHRSVMARHSEVFNSMFLVPQPEADMVETVDGCQVVQMWGDSAVELANLIVALYDGATFSDETIQDFYYTAGILRLASKYFITKLRVQAIQHLSRTWSHTLKGHDDMVDAALRKSLVLGGLSYPRVHPLHIVSLAREVNAPILLPSAIYFLSLYPMEDLLRADHPKLVVEHPSRPSSILSPADLRDYTLMFQKRVDTILHFIRNFCGTRTASTTCRTQDLCTRAFARCSSRLSRSWITRTGPLHFMAQAVQELTDDPKGACVSCRRVFAEDVASLRDTIWDELPSVLHLPPWEQLMTADFEA
ncbi:BTB domain-containing protein [Favolaschia claudopus]|uniref:BTB domain-containing protein n=1 Tax=Favolaschia claudopus TaxID=2862362 RepID=A0AAW0DC08_9AGAR